MDVELRVVAPKTRLTPALADEGAQTAAPSAIRARQLGHALMYLTAIQLQIAGGTST